jgi:hypothetical protein
VAACVLAVVFVACVHAAGVGYVSYASPEDALALQSALEGDAETIVLLSNYSINTEFDEFLDNPLRINRQDQAQCMLPMPTAPVGWQLAQQQQQTCAHHDDGMCSKQCLVGLQ